MLESVRPCRALALIALSTLLVAALPTHAQVEVEVDDTPSTVRPTGGFDRVFLSFAEDAVVAQRQWWEGQFEMNEDGVADEIDAMLLRGIVAFQPWDRVEIGGRVGFGNTDAPAGVEDGTGATDLDAWGKYLIPGDDENLDFAVGALLTLPTGDDTAGLGHDSFGMGLFASLRSRFERVVLGGNAGFRVNGDGQTLGGPEQNGETSFRLGGMALFPLSDTFDLVGEATYESERFENADNDARLLGGVNWRLGERNLLRGALAFGLSDGAPDWQLVAGYAVQFR